MSRPRNIHPAVPLKLRLPLPTRAKLDLYLFSEIEQCVPKGRYAQFLTEMIEDYFRTKEHCPDCGRTRGREIIT